MASVHATFAPAGAASRSISLTIASCPCPKDTFCPAASTRRVRTRRRQSTTTACVQSPSASHGAATRLYVRGLSFRTTEESIRNAFDKFGELTEVNLVMDRVAKRPKGFAFVSYTDEEEAKSAMEGMHGKFLDGRVIFVESAKRRPGV